MSQLGPETLPPIQRLALAYAPRAAREKVLAVMSLDSRLAQVLAARGEPMVAQIKLAWWRDRLKDAPANWPLGEPLLAALARFEKPVGPLVELIDGWEALLAIDEAEQAAIAEFAAGRGAAWALLASELDCEDSATDAARRAREWALHDLAAHLPQDELRTAVMYAAAKESWERARLPRALRPLAVLHALARKAQASGELGTAAGSLSLAMRVGLLGR